MRKMFYFLTTTIFLFTINSCKQVRTSDLDMRPEKNLILMDSIKQLDSLSEYYWMKDDSLSIFYAKSALKIALSLSFSKPTVKAYHILGKAYYVSAKDSSYYYYERALELADKLKSDQQRPSILYNISLLNFYAGNYKEALVLLD